MTWILVIAAYVVFAGLVLGLAYTWLRATAIAVAEGLAGLRRARLDLILSDPRYSRWFAHAYAGVDE